MNDSLKKIYKKQIDVLQQKVMNAIHNGNLEDVSPDYVVKYLSKYINKLAPLKKFPDTNERAEQKKTINEREGLLKDFLLKIGEECLAYIQSPDGLTVIGTLWQEEFDNIRSYVERKKKEIDKKKGDYNSLSLNLNNVNLNDNQIIDIYNELTEIGQNIVKWENDIKRQEMSIPALFDLIGNDRFVKDVDYRYFSKKTAIWGKILSQNLEYWKNLKQKIIKSFPETNWLNIFQYPEAEYILHIPIEDYWWDCNNKQTRIEKLYHELINMGWIAKETPIANFLRVFSFPINPGWWSRIKWLGGNTLETTNNSILYVTKLYYLISAMRNWDWFQENYDVQRGTCLSISRSFHEILTEKDQQKICLFFELPGEKITATSLKFAKNCPDSLFAVEDLIKGL